MRIRHHVNPLRLDFLVPRAQRLELPADPDVEIEMELGCAEGEFLFERACQPGRRLVIGLEIRADLVDQVNRRAGADPGAGEGRVRALFANVNVDLPRLFADGRVARLFLNFPDPWFKRRHRKRRVVDEALAGACAAALRPGGELFFQSDVYELALDALGVLEAEERLHNAAGAWRFWKTGNPYGARSRRERFCEESGRAVWRILMRRAG